MPPTDSMPDGPTPGLRLAYFVVEARRPDRWAAFCADMLGLPAPHANPDGSLGWRVDDAAQRLVVAPGPSDDLSAMGFECADERTLDGAIERLGSAGIEVAEPTPAARRARRVRRLHLLKDPQGNGIELACGLAAAGTRFDSALFRGGFRTGALGMGHLALVVRDLQAMEAFYTSALGFRVTDRLDARVGPLQVRGSFMHCNARHHTLALMQLPLRQRLHHFMLEANDWREVGAAYDRAQRLRVPLSLSLGQHPDPDGTFSFYGQTPSGFDYEIGAGAGCVDPATWQVTHSARTSAWGHAPRWRLKLKTAAALIGARLRGDWPTAASGRGLTAR